MKHKKSRILLALGWMFTFSQIVSVDIGSDTAVNRFEDQQTLQDGDRIAGFASMDGGFALAGLGVRGKFDSFFPVSGNININGGILELSQDLIMHNVSNIRTLGNIDGNHHVLELSPCATCIPRAETDCAVAFVTKKSFNNDVETADWSFDGKFIALGTAQMSGSELQVYEFNGSTLTFKDGKDIGNLEVTCVRWRPGEHKIAVGRVSGSGAEVYIYSVNAVTGALTLVDSDMFSASLNSLAWHPSGDYLAIGGANDTNEIVIYPVDAAGNLNKAGKLAVSISPNRDVETNNALDWDATGTYLAAGTTVNGSNHTLLVYKFATAPGLSLTLNASLNLGRVRAVAWNPVCQNLLAVGLHDNSPRLRIFEHDGNAGTLTSFLTESKNLGKAVRALHWDSTGDCLALGKNMESGSGSGGSDDDDDDDTGGSKDPDDNNGEFKIYKFDKNVPSLLLVSSFNFADQVEQVRWSNDDNFILAGSDADTISVYERLSAVNGDGECFVISDLKIFLNCNVTFKDCCLTFTGQSVINGQGHCLTLEPTCTLILDENSDLLIKDIKILGVNDNRIHGTDATSTFTFKNAELVLDGNYSFTVGKFDVLADLDITGDGFSFNYESDQVSTVRSNGSLNINRGTTFRYDPSINSKLLLAFTDTTSILRLDGGTLETSNVGLQLLNGSLVVDGDSSLINEGTQISQAIILGDGLDQTNNMRLCIEPAATIGVTGQVANKNISS